MNIFLRTLSVCAVLLMTMPSYAQTSDWLTECSVCKCKWNSGKKTADCKNTAMTRVPTVLSVELQVLDLSNNFIPEIVSSEFAMANLRNLHKLFVRNATLKQINRDSLKGLEILIELDLSYNLLEVLPRSVFNNLVKLRALMLNNNKLKRLEDGLFRNLKFLHKIELKDNHLMHIETKAFTNLPLLTQIYLDGNQLTVLRRECFQHLEKLTGLSLKQNPWNCTCELNPFRRFAIDQRLYTPPTDCYYPENLRGTLWTDVPLEAFACQPKIVYPLIGDATISSFSENATITCRIQASPNTIITWTYNKHALNNYPKRIFIKNLSESSSAQDSSEIITSELTIIGARRTDEGVYTCAAHNVGGKVDIDIQLLVGRDGNGMLFITNQMLFVLCLMAVGLLIVSLVIMIVTCCYCRKFKNLIKHDLDDGINGISIGGDGTLNATNGKKHFQAIKLNSFNNATMIGNGSCIVGNTMVISGIDDDTDANVIANKNGGIKITNDTEIDKFAASIEFNHTNIKSDTIRADTHNSAKSHISQTEKKLDTSDVRLHQIVSTSSGVIGSPTSRQMFASANEQSHHHQYQTMQRHHTDSRLPPDLLPYGQHQSLVLQSSLKNSSSSSTGSSTSTAILDHRIQTHSGNNNNNNSISSGGSSNRYAFAYTDDRLSEHLDDDDDESDMQLFVRHTPIEEPDLRIYHNDNVMTKTSKSYAKLNSPSPTTTATAIASNKLTPSNPHRTTNIYELTPASAILNTNYSGGKHFTKTNSSKMTSTLQMNPVTKVMENDGGMNCKPRQSVVRTSPSFSFLSAGYNQQQDNFL
ncbi:uncharacterized protein LOC116342137 [Contarinia nasturtii]|uniref:uncharacterized protein LOC116342137 n=1 Tax=Contarinia nasturtii TaxID=265458 RepID=UPI0012D3CCBC|nr:uncharacterized protein LOC116342137 [Contarinia nasturtii]